MKTTLINLRTYKGNDYTLIDRRTLFGNPYPITTICNRTQSVAKFRIYFEARIKRDVVFRAAVKALRGSKLACWCTPKPCHGDVYIEYLDRVKKENMKMTLNKLKCEVCDDKPIAMVRDMTEEFDFLTGTVKREPLGEPHLFCEKHNRVSKITDITQTVKGVKKGNMDVQTDGHEV